MMWEGLKVKDQQPQGQLTWHLPLSWTHTHTLSETMSTVCSHTASQALGLIKTLYNTHTQWSFLCVHCVLESGWGYQSIQQRVGGGWCSFLPSGQSRVRNAHLEPLSIKLHPVFEFLRRLFWSGPNIVESELMWNQITTVAIVQQSWKHSTVPNEKVASLP